VSRQHVRGGPSTARYVRFAVLADSYPRKPGQAWAADAASTMAAATPRPRLQLLPVLIAKKVFEKAYRVLQGCRPGEGASRRVIRPTIAHLTIATEVLVSRS
jgi:hypothetical protein